MSSSGPDGLSVQGIAVTLSDLPPDLSSLIS